MTEKRLSTVGDERPIAIIIIGSKSKTPYVHMPRSKLNYLGIKPPTHSHKVILSMQCAIDVETNKHFLLLRHLTTLPESQEKLSKKIGKSKSGAVGLDTPSSVAKSDHLPVDSGEPTAPLDVEKDCLAFMPDKYLIEKPEADDKEETMNDNGVSAPQVPKKKTTVVEV